jgi:hypothetical protein
MGNYLINNGPSWVNFCNCEINIKDHNNIWQYINPYQCEIKYWTGTKWCLFELNNIFNYTTGQAPTLADFEDQIGFTLINGAKFGDTIVFDNVGYTVADAMFAIAGLTGFFKCSAGDFGDFAFAKNSIEKVYLTENFTSGENVLDDNNITHVFIEHGVILGNYMFLNNNLQYINIRSVLNIGSSTGDDGVFFGNTGNNVTVIALLIHETSNGGGREGDLQYLDDENTVTFDWNGYEVPDWINTCGTL